MLTMRAILLGGFVACVACAAACASFSEPDAGADASAETGASVVDASADAASETSAGTPLPQPDHGIVVCDVGSSDPNEQQCETKKGERCCYPTPATPTCRLTCTAAVAVVACDETADCGDGEVCCASAGLRTECTASCAATRVCKTDAECNGGVCEPYDCLGRRLGACSNSSAPPTAPCTKL